VILESPRQFGITEHTLSNGIIHKKLNGDCNTDEKHNTHGIHSIHKTDGHGVSDMATIESRASQKEVNRKSVAHMEDQQALLLFSAYSAGALESQVDAYHKYIKGIAPKLRDLAYTMANKREQKPYRAYAVVGDVSTLEVSAIQVAPNTPPRVVWVFTGQGAQWPEMGADLIDTNATFRETIRKLDKFLLSLPAPPTWTIEGM
jgi:acyl transferase domain-containing protein